MTRILIIAMAALLANTTPALAAWSGDGQPLKYISSCELDLNKDDLADIVLLVETIQGRELIAVLKNKSGLSAFLLWKGPSSNGMHLKCEVAKFEVKETPTAAAKTPGTVHKTNGAVVHLYKPESTELSFFWENSRFIEVVTAD